MSFLSPIASGIVGAVIVACTAGGVLFGYRWSDQNHEAEKQREAAERAKYEAMWRDRHYELSAAFEELKAAKEKRRTEVRHEVERIVERPVYLRECFDADGLRQLNTVRGVPAAPEKPGAVLPRPAAGDRRDRGGPAASNDRGR